ncbi:restriction endonuclease subunit S, partial [Methanomethylophilus alvi]|uniref:restriction endonuclease subunit S n=1 Tax=Methanomethylophilus alvi TaxID=1291540 RepID=UPI0037DC762D
KSRFIEITKNDIERRALDDLSLEWFKGQGLKKDEIDENGNNYCIHYGELFTKYGPVIDEVVSKTSVVPNRVSSKGDILFPASDVTPNGLARCSEVEWGGVILGGDIICLRPKAVVNPAFLSYAINAEKQQLLQGVTGSVVKHMSPKWLKKVIVSIPHEKSVQDEFISFAKQVDKSKVGAPSTILLINIYINTEA